MSGMETINRESTFTVFFFFSSQYKRASNETSRQEASKKKVTHHAIKNKVVKSLRRTI